MKLNERAALLCDHIERNAEQLRVLINRLPCGARLIDCGNDARGGLEAGKALAEVCLAGLGQVQFVASSGELSGWPAVLVTTDHPLRACMASQYAGWKIAGKNFFAMGSGPMRAAAGREALFKAFAIHEKPSMAVGALETQQFPSDDICLKIAEQAGVDPAMLTLLIAPTASQAGTVQIVARSVETALHKLHELGFELSRVESGYGVAPLPPVGENDLAAIGRTNDAILYGAEVTLWVRGDDASLEAIGPRVPSSSSADYGRPFRAIFEHYQRDFYKIDPHLFSPAVITLANLDTGRSFRFGHTLPRVIHESFDTRQISP